MHDCLSIFCCLRVPKSFVDEPLGAVFQNISGSQKTYAKEVIITFLSKIWWVTVPKNFVAESLSGSLSLGIENVYG